MKLFTVLDNKANVFNTPFPAPTDVHAVRTFQMQINHADAGNMLNFAPSDFDLYHIGDFNDKTGEIEPCTPNLLMNGAKLIRETK